jgi:KaiC/GvpD/RAD55 family RecA-like ATPase
MGLPDIPNEIKYLTQFVGHRAKVPINLKTGANASSVDPSSWVPFQQAVTRYKLYGCDGIGFVIKPPYLGVDLDDCVENGAINPFGKSVIEKLNSYTEYSPSGTGIHIICKGTIDRAIKKDTHEVYREGRYFTMTGDVINHSLIEERSSEIKELFYSDPTNGTSNKQGWIAETLSTLQPGNLHNLSIKVIGKLHQNRWGKEDIFTLLKPHIERVGGDLVALKERIESISKYPIADSIIKEASLTNGIQQETYSISSFLALDDKVTWLVPGIISDKSLGFIAGLPETGKTWVCMDLAVECARGGGYWLGKFPVKDAKVLYIDQERWKGETKRRLQAIIGAKAVSKDSVESKLFIKSGTTIRLDLQHSFDAFRREVQNLKPDLIIVDSFATFHTKEENNRKDIQEVLERVKQIRNEIGCAFLFVDHEGKSVFSDEDKTPNMAKMVGSIGKPAAAEYVLTVRKDGEGSMVYMTKSTMGPAVEPFLVKVEDIENAGVRVKAY